MRGELRNEVARREWNGEGKSSAWSSQRIRAGEGEDGVRRTWRQCCMARAWRSVGRGAAAWPRVVSVVMR
jgi:hypothetical protein